MIYDQDPYLLPFKGKIDERFARFAALKKKLSVKGSLSKGINNHLFYGLHRLDDGNWVIREWAPNATKI